MANYIKFTDVVQLQVEHRIKDLMLSLGPPQRRSLQNRPSGNTRSLVVEIAATHSGKVTLNNGLYLPDKMAKGVPSWTSPYLKPILLHHNDSDDAVGRVKSASYVDISGTQQPILNALLPKDSKTSDKLFDAFLAGELPLKEAAQVANTYIIKNYKKNVDYQGLGFIKLQATLSDPDVISKVLDGRFLTGSVGARTNHAICSICQKDWAEDGACEHRPGVEYEDSLCVLVAGDLEYEEWSYVNHPADVHSGTIEIYMDGVKKDSISYDPSYRTPEVCLTITDSLEEKMFDLQDLKTRLGDELSSFLIGEDASEEDLHYAHMVLEVKEGLRGEEGEDLWEPLKEKKLSSAERKKMGKSTFCKPGERKYPVGDCSHAKSAMAYAKKYNESSSVLACIRRKAARLGCPFKSKDEAPDFGIFNLEYFDSFEDEALLQLHVGIRAALAERSLCESCEDASEVEALQAQLEENKKTLDETLLALSVKDDELSLLKTSQSCDSEALVQATLDSQSTKKAYLVALKRLSGISLEDATKEVEALNLPSTDLQKIIDNFSSQVDIQKIVDRAKSGIANNPAGLSVEDPTLGDLREDKQHQIVLTKEDLGSIQERFMYIRMKQGQDAAEQWLDTLKRQGLLPKEKPTMQ